MIDHYLMQAEKCAVEAAATDLPYQRKRFLLAAHKWLTMAQTFMALTCSQTARVNVDPIVSGAKRKRRPPVRGKGISAVSGTND
jgi:hypothetical protein